MFVIVETFLNIGEPSTAEYRVRPVPGQAFPPSMRVQCSKALRRRYPLGAKFRFPVTLVQREGGGKFLRQIGTDPWEVITQEC